MRLALGTDYARTPLRRTDISSKILASTPGSRNFKPIFALAQTELQTTFGMQLVELPSREKTGLKERRALASQAKIAAASASSKSWVLVSTLPAAYKNNAAIVTPTQAGNVDAEATYTALYTFVVAVIMLNNGTLAEAKLERYLKRVNVETYTSLAPTERVLARMAKDGYVEKRRDTSSGEEVVEWVVGPRGKVEVGPQGVSGLVKQVYGMGNGDGEDEEGEDELDKKIKRSLGIRDEGARIIVEGGPEDGAQEAEVDETQRPSGARRGRPRKEAAAAREEDNEDDD